MSKRSLFLLACIIVWCLILQASSAEDIPIFGPLIPKESRRTLIATESGVITAVDVFDGLTGAYHLQFFTLEPSSLFLPVLLHTDMVFYVQTGRGTVSWARDDSKDGTTNLDVERGDVYRLEEGSIFYIRSHPDPAREKLRIHAIFNNFNSEDSQETSVGVYSNVSDLVCGFDDRVLQMGFKASEDDVRAIKSAIKPPPIVHFAPNKTEKPNWTEVFETLMGRNPISIINGKKKKKTKTKTFNVFKETPDVENCNGWSVAVTNRGLSALKHSNIGVFMVNLTKGSMMGPHWNPKATEIATVIEGQGMVQIVCAGNPSGSQPTGLKCQNMRFKVREGDVFIVPRFNPMAQMSFNYESLVFMGFSTSVKNNHPQYLAGKWSVLRTIDKDILAVSLGASNATIEKILTSQDEGVMLECTSCAEEVEKTMEEEIERRREEEEARKREEEEEKRRREEEEARKREEEEEKKKREEEARKREEEARKREEEEEKKREEEEARKREEEEEKKRREEEEARKKREEEEEKKREEEKKKREEEEKKRREEEEARKREEEEEKKREEEEEARKREEEEEKKRREEEEARKREEEEKKREEEEEARKREEEEAKKREEEEEKKREEETRKREEEEKKEEEEEEEEEVRRREEEEEKKREEEARKREEEEKKEREEEEEKKRREEEEARKREEEEETRRREEEARKREEEEEARTREEETRKEEEKEARKKQEEEVRRREEEEGRERKEEEAMKKEEEEARKRQEEEEEIRRQEEEAKKREEGGRDRKIDEDEEEKKGNQETSGGGRVMWRKIWMAKS